MSRPNKPHPWLSCFFAFGATTAGLTIVLLLFPGSAFEPIWRLNPDAHAAFQSLGRWSVLLMFVVSAGCASAAIGLWRGLRWGARLAIIILSLNLIGDLANVVLRRDYRALIGIPVAGAMIIYLARRG